MKMNCKKLSSEKIIKLSEFFTYLCNISVYDANACPSPHALCPFQKNKCTDVIVNDWITWITEHNDDKTISNMTLERKCAISNYRQMNGDKHMTCIKAANNDVCPLHVNNCDEVSYADWLNWMNV